MGLKRARQRAKRRLKTRARQNSKSQIWHLASDHHELAIWGFPRKSLSAVMADGKGKGRRNGKGDRGQSYLQQRADGEGHLALGWDWYCIDDVVMGGRSSSTVSGGPAVLNFAGTISTVGGGFASCKTKTPESALELPHDAQGIKITVSGMPTHNLKFNLKVTPPDEIPTEMAFGEGQRIRQRWASMDDSQKRQAMENMNWRAIIPMQDNGGKQSIFLPFSIFFATMTGQPVTGLTLDPKKIVGFGLNASIFDESGVPDPKFNGGGFSFTLHEIGFMPAPML